MEGRPLEDDELIEHARRGELNAYDELVRRYRDVAVRTAYVVAGSADDAEDAAQDAFVKAYAALGRFRAGAPFRPWLLRIVANEARNRRRSAGRRAALSLRAAAEESSGGAAPSPEGAVLAGEDRERLLEAVNGLREEERLVIACRFFLELSEEETAAALDVRLGTIKSRTSRALERLRTELGGEA